MPGDATFDLKKYNCFGFSGKHWHGAQYFLSWVITGCSGLRMPSKNIPTSHYVNTTRHHGTLLWEDWMSRYPATVIWAGTERRTFTGLSRQEYWRRLPFPSPVDHILSVKDRNGMDLTEAEDIKKTWQEYTEELHKPLLLNGNKWVRCTSGLGLKNILRKLLNAAIVICK